MLFKGAGKVAGVAKAAKRGGLKHGAFSRFDQLTRVRQAQMIDIVQRRAAIAFAKDGTKILRGNAAHGGKRRHRKRAFGIALMDL